MTIRAVLFDVYGTLLRVGPPPADADARWESLFRKYFGRQPDRSRLEFSVACSQIIAQRHAAARARGIPHPEVLWPSVVTEVLPELAQLPASAQAEFVFRQMQTGRTITLQDSVGEALAWLQSRGCLLGIASNSQAYTLRELDELLTPAGLGLDIIDRDLCFWSYENGFSKPDPHVFRILTTRLQNRSICPAETLMIGDRLDNDIEPARAQGWQTWHLKPTGSAPASDSGDFHALCAALG